ncbi:MAG: protein-L-isoaspartate(D-aspartate) O-methyltransferase [Actinobacteria bacterium]|nr:protein-L-isoaspartate(D-aspartate) O-methyltransferase [Actinomycetota bacterium]
MQNSEEKDNYLLARQNMVSGQIIARGIKDEKVISAMRKVRRQEYTDEEMRQFAYEDRPLPIGQGQTISQPYIVALMTELLCLKGDEKVLEIGTGSGYQTAIIAEIAAEVYSIEIIKPLYERAKKALSKYNNIHLKNDDGYNGWLQYSPYDRIIATAAPEKIPKPLTEQLKDGGIMVLPCGPSGFSQVLYKIVKKGKDSITERVCDVAFVPFTRNMRK